MSNCEEIPNDVLSTSTEYPAEVTDASESAGPRKQFCVKDLVIEMPPGFDAIAINVLQTMQVASVDMTQDSTTMWRLDGTIIVPKNNAGTRVTVSGHRQDVGHITFGVLDQDDFTGFEDLLQPSKVSLVIKTEESAMEITVTLQIYPSNVVEEEDNISESDNEQDEAGALFNLLATVPDDKPEKPHQLNKCGNLFLGRFKDLGNAEDIDNAIVAFNQATQMIPPEDTALMDYFWDASLAYYERFLTAGKASDLDLAIPLIRKAIDATPQGHSNMPALFNHLGDLLTQLFPYSDDVSQINQAVELQQRAIDLTPDERHPNLPVWFNSLGLALMRRFERFGVLADISSSITAKQKAVDLTPDNHVDLPGRLNNLGNSVLARFERGGDPSDISKAVSTQSKAISLITDEDPAKATILDGLGNSLMRRSKLASYDDDISRAIEIQQRAIELSANEDVLLPARLNNLGVSYMHNFYRTAHFEDINNAVKVQKKAVAITPDDHPDKVIWIEGLGTSLSSRFQYDGDLRDISDSISFLQKAVNLTPENDALRSNRLNILGLCYMYRSERTVDHADILDAVSNQQEAVQLTPVGHAELPFFLDCLGLALISLYEHEKSADLGRLSTAIEIHRQAVQLTHEDNPLDLASYLHSLGTSLVRLFKLTKDPEIISEAINAQHRAVELTPASHSANRAVWLNNLGIALLSRYTSTGHQQDIVEAIISQQRAVSLVPDGHGSKPTYLRSLAESFEQRHRKIQDISDMHEAIENIRRAAVCTTGSLWVRFGAALKWGEWSQKYDRSQTVDAYRVALDLFSQVTGMEETITRRHAHLLEIAQLSTGAAAVALQFGRADLALEWLEEGRCTTWSHLNQLRTPLDKLRAHNSKLADQFSALSSSLESLGSRQELYGGSSLPQKMELQKDANLHVKVAYEWNQLLADIRSIPTFEDFLRPRKAGDLLRNLPEDGPVIVINIHPDRCDALALLSGSDAIEHIPLLNFSEERAHKYLEQLRGSLKRNNLRSVPREYEALPPAASRGIREAFDDIEGSVICEILGGLWLNVVKPILDHLKYKRRTPDVGRIWWCPTGALSSLPLHAAGIYGEGDPDLQISVCDFAASSYTPTVTTLLQKVEKRAKSKSKSPCKLLLISQPNTPGCTSIPETQRETQLLLDRAATHDIEALRLNSEDATIARVTKEMDRHGWVHFACHAAQILKTPLDSGFYLHDGSLRIWDILNRHIAIADFAFLSACQTSTGDEKLSEEAVHLAAGMLAAGYQSVVSTMWSIIDKHGAAVADDFYAHLLKERSDIEIDNRVLNSAEAAMALHHSIQRLRTKVGDSEAGLLKWVPFVHFGL